MSEIKFACPHCRQHIVCDPGYVDMCIVCPTCGKPMVVPTLSAGESTPPEMCVVASPPAPRRRLTTRIPQLHVWQADEWEEHLRADESAPIPQFPHWVLCAFGTTIVVGFLFAFSVRSWIIIAGLIAGIALCFYFFAKGGEASASSPVYKTIGWLLALIVCIPVILVGIAFIGCCAIG